MWLCIPAEPCQSGFADALTISITLKICVRQDGAQISHLYIKIRNRHAVVHYWEHCL